MGRHGDARCFVFIGGDRGIRMNEFLSMGGYGAYVWTSYLAGLVVVLRRTSRSSGEATSGKVLHAPLYAS